MANCKCQSSFHEYTDLLPLVLILLIIQLILYEIPMTDLSTKRKLYIYKK